MWRVMGLDPVRLMWTVRSEHDDEGAAIEKAEAMQHHDPRLRVRVMCTQSRRVLKIKPPIISQTREFRFKQAGAASDRLDANKRYKSMG